MYMCVFVCVGAGGGCVLVHRGVELCLCKIALKRLIMSVTFDMLQINITIIYLKRQTQTTHRNIVQVSLVRCMCGVYVWGWV